MTRDENSAGHTFGQLLREYRLSAALTQAGLAERASISARAVQDLERGLSQPHRDTLDRLVNALELAPGDRLVLTEAAAPTPRRRNSRSTDTMQAQDDVLLQRASRGVPHNLPAPSTALIGRDVELETARNQLLREDARLVTLTGPGGCGKTRLGLHLGTALIAHFPDGVFFVPLAPVGDPDLVATTIAQALGLRESEGGSIRQVVRQYLEDRRVLLLIDNFEHVIAAGSDIGELLAVCPQVKALVTSRAPLRIYGEHEIAVPPLSTPESQTELPIERLAQYEAVRLFVERAQSVRGDFSLTDGNAGAVVEICRHLDGLPLAIELAAARIRVLSPNEVLTRLSDPFAFLTDSARDRPPRQRTLRDAIAWSHELLPDQERRLFRTLSVFRGGWTIEAAEAVCDQPVGVLEGLSSLVSWSLVRQGAGRDGASRFSMLETILEYARGELLARGEEEQVRGLHAAYFLVLAECAEPALRGKEQAAWLDRLETEIDNLRAALTWLTDRREVEAALRMCAALAWFWGIRGYWTEGRSWLERTLDGTAGGPLDRTPVRMRALQGAGWLAHVQNDGSSARRLLEDSLSVAREVDDRHAIAWALHLLGRVTYFEGDFAAAGELGHAALALSRAIDDQWVAGWSLHLLARAAHMRGEYVAARELYAESLAVRRELGDRDGSAIVFGLMGMLSFHERKYDDALALLARGLRLAHELHYGWPEANMVAVFACVASATGHPVRATRLAAAAERRTRALAVTLVPDHRVALDAALERARADLGQPVFAAAWSEGDAMSTDQAVAYALDDSHTQASGSDGPLSPRERDVALLVARGLSNRQLANELVISTRTADHHVANILAKLGLDTRAQIAGWVERIGMRNG